MVPNTGVGASFTVAEYDRSTQIITTTDGDRYEFLPDRVHRDQRHADPTTGDQLRITEARYFTATSSLVRAEIIAGCACTALRIRPMPAEDLR